MRKRLLILVCLLLFPCIALADLTIYFLDVQQGDSAVVVCDGEAMIIDGGLPGQSSKVYSFLTKDLHYDRFLYMVATHPDNDHIGGLPAVFQAAKDAGKSVRYVFSPIKEYNSPRFSDLIKKAQEQHLKIKVPYDGDEVPLGTATVTFYNCGSDKKSIGQSIQNWVSSLFNRDDPEENKEANDMSLVVKITYGENTILFTGDIEEEAEKRLIGQNYDIHADVLKVAHHGSSSSSSLDFLSRVNPKYAVISCGKNNRYGHPEQQTLDQFKQSNVQLYRTDLEGTITCRCDGHSIVFETERTTNSNEIFKAPAKK